MILAADGSVARGQRDLRTRFQELVDGHVTFAIEVLSVLVASDLALASTRLVLRTPVGEPFHLAADVVYRRTVDEWLIAIDRIKTPT